MTSQFYFMLMHKLILLPNVSKEYMTSDWPDVNTYLKNQMINGKWSRDFVNFAIEAAVKEDLSSDDFYMLGSMKYPDVLPPPIDMEDEDGCVGCSG